MLLYQTAHLKHSTALDRKCFHFHLFLFFFTAEALKYPVHTLFHTTRFSEIFYSTE